MLRERELAVYLVKFYNFRIKKFTAWQKALISLWNKKSYEQVKSFIRDFILLGLQMTSN